MKIYVVLSRDTDYLFVTTDKWKAEKFKKIQVRNEEMSGGRPSVYIKETLLII